MEIKMYSGERNKLIRILENYKVYVQNDKKLNEDYKKLELRDMTVIFDRLMGQAPIENYRVVKDRDSSVFGYKE